VRLSILLFDGYTALDVVGGYEVLSRVPQVETELVASRKGVIAADTRRLGMTAYRDFSEVNSTDILYVPGGPGVEAALKDERLIAWVQQMYVFSKWNVSVCNGAAILGEAGILKGKVATTNWGWRDKVAQYGATITKARYHRDGNLVTGAGVSASIDTGLFLASLLASEQVARTIQLGIEYYPDPPFGNSSADEQPLPMREALLKFEKKSIGMLKQTKLAC